jgi:site-specific recombinase XerD
MIALGFGAGLRVSEVVKLRVRDIDLHGGIINVHHINRQKTRNTLLPGRIVPQLQLLTVDRPIQQSLFISDRGRPFSVRAIQTILIKACRRAGVKKPVSFNTLRNSFAAYLLNKGTDIRYVQYLLGHQNRRSTQFFTYVANWRLSNIEGPLDYGS